MSIFTMNTINKSFLWGIVFASVTWIISVYLYMQLAASTGPSFAISTQFSSPTGKIEQVIIKKNKINNDLNLIISNNIGNAIDKQIHAGVKDAQEKNKKVETKSYVNSDKLIKSLQPVLPTSPAKINKGKWYLLGESQIWGGVNKCIFFFRSKRIRYGQNFR